MKVHVFPTVFVVWDEPRWVELLPVGKWQTLSIANWVYGGCKVCEQHVPGCYCKAPSVSGVVNDFFFSLNDSCVSQLPLHCHCTNQDAMHNQGLVQ